MSPSYLCTPFLRRSLAYHLSGRILSSPCKPKSLCWNPRWRVVSKARILRIEMRTLAIPSLTSKPGYYQVLRLYVRDAIPFIIRRLISRQGDGMNVDIAREEVGIDPRITNNASTAADIPQGLKMDVTSTSIAAFFDTIPTRTSQDASPLPMSLASRRTRRNTGAKNSQLPPGTRKQDLEAPGFSRLDAILSDLSDFDDDVPISKMVKSKLGKHARPDSPIESPSPELPTKPTRRLVIICYFAPLSFSFIASSIQNRRQQCRRKRILVAR